MHLSDFAFLIVGASSLDIPTAGTINFGLGISTSNLLTARTCVIPYFVLWGDISCRECQVPLRSYRGTPPIPTTSTLLTSVGNNSTGSSETSTPLGAAPA
ncbi:hypothetical protein F5Y09DRAFT_300538 [Xylaria sp. FL1042]|nr:hypothetical protein F5Y09DRAFT_300538 [Xylaria sp. FL1042]